MLFASGMCAATTTFLALLPAGSHLIVTSDCYRRTRQFIQQYLAKLGVETTVIEPATSIALKAAIRPDTRDLLHRVADESVPARDRRAGGCAASPTRAASR